MNPPLPSEGEGLGVRVPADWCRCDGTGGLDERAVWSRRAVMAAGVSWLASRSALAQATFAQDKQDRNVVVVVFLRGGADGLHLVTPYFEDAYYRGRPALATRAPSDRRGGPRCVDLDGRFGLHPTLAPLLPAWADGELGIVHAVGSGDSTHSHFEAMATMERGLTNQSDLASGGWLARHLESQAGTSVPLRAVAWGYTMPESLSGAASATLVETLSDFRLRAPRGDVRERLAHLYQTGGDQLSEAGAQTLGVLQTLEKLDPKEYKPENGADYPKTPTGQAMKEVAFLVRQRVGLEVACLDSGGWDSHVNQAYLDQQMGDLAKTLAALRQDLGREMSRVTVVVQSEFGRRVEENSGLGTDHGAGGVFFAMGGGVAGGKVYGDWPGIGPDQRTGPGDLRITTDYRTVLAEILEKRLGSGAVPDVFPALDSKRLGLFRA
ncbi:MAG: DUF1501 domain-containing protein [Armatimonadetes bacterium]|nr:DUF1501 domain-containing protein [Armatimonadota bacterium]